MEVIINNTKIKYEHGKVYSFIKKANCKNYKWFLLKGSINKCGYRIVRINKKLYNYHRVIYQLFNKDWDIDDYSQNNFIDHIDRNTLNNNIENLRVVTRQENSFNTNAKGYSWNKQCNKWQVQLMVNGEYQYGELFIHEEDARNKYLEMKKIYHVI